jgi:hypothetical protein
MVQFNGHFDGRVITPDEQVEIPIGMPLRITIEPATKQMAAGANWQQLLKLADECAIDGPADLAERHDFYAHHKAAD